MEGLTYYSGNTPSEVTNFINGLDVDLISITYDGRYYVAFYRRN